MKKRKKERSGISIRSIEITKNDIANMLDNIAEELEKEINSQVFIEDAIIEQMKFDGLVKEGELSVLKNSLDFFQIYFFKRWDIVYKHNFRGFNRAVFFTLKENNQ